MNAVQKASESGISSGNITPEQIELIKNTVAKDATPDEFRLFLHYCNESGLDPLRKQAHFIKRRYKDRQGNWQSTVQMMTGVDGFRSRAEQMPDFKGIKSCAVREGDEISIDMGSGEVSHKLSFPRTGKILGAWAQISRENRSNKIIWVDFGEYNEQNSPLWKSKPAVMIEKVAESSLLRHEYPEKFSTMYHPAEIENTNFNEETGDVTAIETEVEVSDITQANNNKSTGETESTGKGVLDEPLNEPSQPEPQPEPPQTTKKDEQNNLKKYSKQFNIGFVDLISRASVSCGFKNPTTEQRRHILILWLANNGVDISTDGLISEDGVHVSVLGESEIRRLLGLLKINESLKACSDAINNIEWNDNNYVVTEPEKQEEELGEKDYSNEDIKSMRELLSKKFGFSAMKVYIKVCQKHGYAGNEVNSTQETRNTIYSELEGVRMMLEEGTNPEEIEI